MSQTSCDQFKEKQFYHFIEGMIKKKLQIDARVITAGKSLRV